MAEIKDFPIRETGKETPERILNVAKKWNASDLVVVGIVDGEIYVAATDDNIPSVLGLIEFGKHELLTQGD